MRALAGQAAGRMIAGAGLEPDFSRAAEIFQAHATQLRRDRRAHLLEAVAATANAKAGAAPGETEWVLQPARSQRDSQTIMTSAVESLFGKCGMNAEEHFAAAAAAARASKRNHADEL
jgi:hypothetical protein